MATPAAAAATGAGAAAAAEAFRRVYDTLKDELLRDPAFDFNDDAIQWLDGVGLIAINDGLVLRSQISRIFRRYFLGKTYYVDLLDLFNEVEFQTTSGELLDQITTNEGRKDLNKYTVHAYRRIVEYKTAYYSFYLPSLDDYAQVKQILVEMGVYFQIQDDYLDCFGDPDVIGKIGTDIEDFKCSWLFVEALQRADEKQKNLLFENYGKSDPACVAQVKALYKELDLEVDI
ncbi:Farnesyl pyrophosphate synthase [Dichanthelium oligosanthes]|uniref:Farnesyl pyrophosphate synthase n=1 Tax=Dichanthelium oligosanthes TaxID=888268 RepID=A0A1E5WDQ5_9POAL|nr:Farnesyl pyrophosphate synthase [Dichanthelium oligosanthes]